MPETSSSAHRHRSRNRDSKRKRQRSRSSHRRKKESGTSRKHHKRHHDHKRKEHENDVENPISEEDYYLKSLEFRVWLLEKKKKCFQALSDVDQKKYFKKFCEKWNRGKLPKMYYDVSRIPEELVVNARRDTSYKWGFENKMTQKDAQELDDLRHRVDRDTTQAKDDLERVNRFQAALAASGAAGPSLGKPATRKPIGPAMPPPK